MARGRPRGVGRYATTGTCRVCVHPDKDAIDGALLKGDAYRVVGERFGLSFSSVGRHCRNHLAGEVPAGTVTGKRPAPTFDAGYFRRLGNQLAEQAQAEADAGRAGAAHQLMLTAGHAWARADSLKGDLEDSELGSALDRFIAHLTGDGDDQDRPPLRAVE